MAADLIVALSSPPGPAARGVVRLSGAGLRDVTGRFLDVWPATPGFDMAVLVATAVGDVPGRAVRFQGPRSYTGEDVLELHVPGHTVVTSAVIDAALAAGARGALPGEFTRRAWANGKITFEDVDRLGRVLEAETRAERRAAAAAPGVCDERLEKARDRVSAALALLEAGLDFEEAETGSVGAEERRALLAEAQASVETALDDLARGPGLAGEVRVFLDGPPNAGKSTLLNALDPAAGALVSPVAGTTRDHVTGRFEEGGLLFRVCDAPGRRDGSEEGVDAEARTAAERVAEGCDLRIEVVGHEGGAPDGTAPADLVVVTGRDRGGAAPAEGMWVSGTTGEGVALLRAALQERAAETHRSAGLEEAMRRHGLLRARRSLHRASLRDGREPELAAEDLREAFRVLGGVDLPESVLDRVFERFCIGK